MQTLFIDFFTSHKIHMYSNLKTHVHIIQLFYNDEKIDTTKRQNDKYTFTYNYNITSDKLENRITLNIFLLIGFYICAIGFYE